MSIKKDPATINAAYTVSEEDTAKKVGSGGLDVLATPKIALWIEEICYRSLEDTLPDELTSVGSQLEIKHIFPTPVGDMVTIIIKPVMLKENHYRFDCSVIDSKGREVATGTHSRVVVNTQKFLDKIDQ